MIVDRVGSFITATLFYIFYYSEHCFIYREENKFMKGTEDEIYRDSIFIRGI